MAEMFGGAIMKLKRMIRYQVEIGSKMSELSAALMGAAFFLQALYFFLPRNTERMVAAPAPTNVPNAVDRFIRGKVTARPDIARGPTPCPI